MKYSKERQKQMDLIHAASIPQRTSMFWQIATAWNRNIGPMKGITIEKAISILSDIEEFTPIGSILGNQVTDLLDTIIGRPIEKKVYADGFDGPDAA